MKTLLSAAIIVGTILVATAPANAALFHHRHHHRHHMHHHHMHRR